MEIVEALTGLGAGGDKEVITMAEYEPVTNMLRWTARIGSILSLAFVAAFIIGELSADSRLPQLSAAGVLMGLCFPVGVCAGMIVSWRRSCEGVGGMITFGSLVLFYAIDYAMSGSTPTGPWFALAALPGAFYLSAWMLSDGADGHIATT